MKNIIKLSCTLLSFILCLSLTSSCSKEENDDMFVGTWRHDLGSDSYQVLEFKSNGTGRDYFMYPDPDKKHWQDITGQQPVIIENERHFTYVHTDENVVIDNDAVIYFIDGGVLYKDNWDFRKDNNKD